MNDQGDTAIYRFAGCELDIAQQELRRNGEPVPTEPQVFDLLAYLVRNRDRVVSKDDLIETIWHGRAISDTALTSRISAARRAIGDDGISQALIRTYVKRGFRFLGDVAEGQVSDPALSKTEVESPAIPPNPVIELVRRAEEPPSPGMTLPDKPSIAVLPLQNMSGDVAQEYFADGLTEDIITALSQQRWLFVIARNSTFIYKNQAVDIRGVAQQLGVRYVLEGSVRKAGERVRVNAQLIDANTGVHLWAEKYDRELADVLGLQDEITDRVIGAVGPQILVAEVARIRRKPPQSIDAWDSVMRALPHLWRVSMDSQHKAQVFLNQAIALDGEYAHPHGLLGWSYLSMFNTDTRRPITEFTDRALEAGQHAVNLDYQEPWGHLVLGLGHARRRRPRPAVDHLTRSLELNPNFALGHAGLGYALACGGEPERGLKSLEQAERLSPRDQFLAIYAPTVRYMALFALGRYEEALAVCRATVAIYPNHAGAWRLTTVCLGLLDRIEEARNALSHTLSLQPDLSSAHVEQNTVFSEPSDRNRFLLGLRKAGIE